MIIVDWVPSLVTTSGFAGVLWLSRKLIITRLKNAVKHEYDVKLEELKAEIRSKESDIQALRDGALSGVINRSSVLYERRVKAVEELWEAVTSLAAAKNISSKLAVLNIEAISKKVGHDDTVQQMVNAWFGNFDMNSVDVKAATNARPFISPLAWAYFDAYMAIISHSLIRMHSLRIGIGDDFSDINGITKVVKQALPHQLDYIEKFGASGFHHLLDELENKILVEIQVTLNGEEFDQQSITQANKILKASQELTDELGHKQ
ncbi:hypothetical protein [Photobacterium damselae]|uniref:hypothetical protein n=1 Tax=Photobacterium damselae TaxID=38293 RepID=UPI00165E92C4|nr:hypothetical protein [Photobacterium damselae]